MERLGTIFADNMREYRRKSGLTQEKLAEMVNVSTHHIGMIELTRNFPTFDLIERIAKALDIEIYELFVDSASPREELDKLRQDIVSEIKQTVAEAVKEAFTDNCKGCRDDPPEPRRRSKVHKGSE
jgi:transcriptional regulator with XRE-family HTH domain